MKTLNYRGDEGFTLIEILAVLILAGALVSISGLLLGPMIQSYYNAREASSLMHRAQLGMARVARELQTVTNLVAGTATSITYDMLDGAGVSHRRTISWAGAGAPVLLGGAPLVAGVQVFGFTYLDESGGSAQTSWGTDSRVIEVRLDLGAAGSVYTNRFVPRNLEGET